MIPTTNNSFMSSHTDDSSQLTMLKHRPHWSRASTHTLPLTCRPVIATHVSHVCNTNLFDHYQRTLENSLRYESYISQLFRSIISSSAVGQEDYFEQVCLSILKPLKRKFPVVIYAPPASGKTTFLERCPAWLKCCDTDYVQSWMYEPDLVVTNIPSLITIGTVSIVVIPSERVFAKRCRSRGLPYVREWHQYAKAETVSADIKLFSDAYIDKVLQFRGDTLTVPNLQCECIEEFTPDVKFTLGEHGKVGTRVVVRK